MPHCAKHVTPHHYQTPAQGSHDVSLFVGVAFTESEVRKVWRQDKAESSGGLSCGNTLKARLMREETDFTNNSALKGEYFF